MDKSERETKVQKITVKDTRVKLVEITEKKGSVRTRMKFNDQEEENFDRNKQMQELREKLLKEYAEIFKTNLTKEDRINMDPVVIETVRNRTTFKPVNRMTAIETHSTYSLLLQKNSRKC
jgi:hypothetical protein